MKAITYSKPIMRNGRLNINNLNELLPLMDAAVAAPANAKAMEWDGEDGFHYILVDFLNGFGVKLQQNGNDYRLV